MIGIRHFLHPIRTTRAIYRKAHLSIYRRVAGEQLPDIRRLVRDACWCGGTLGDFRWHDSYGVCTNCSGYVNRRPPAPEEFNRIYSFDYYWHNRQKFKGSPAIEQRPASDRSDGRVAFWLNLIERHCPNPERTVEVGCGSAVLLSELKTRGYECIGVEVDAKSAGWTRQTTGLDVRFGIFPEVDLPSCGLFMAFDVIEHSSQPHAFLKRAAQLLMPGGVAIIQTPIDRYDYRPPFGERFKDAFDDLEHLFLFTDKAVRLMAESAGLEVVSLSERLWLHHEIAILRKP